MNQRGIHARTTVPHEGEWPRRLLLAAVERVGDEKHVRVNVARLIVTNWQQSRTRRVLQHLAGHRDLVTGLDDVSLLVGLCG